MTDYPNNPGLESLDTMLTQRGSAPVVILDRGNNTGFHEPNMIADVTGITVSEEGWWVKIALSSQKYTDHNYDMAPNSWMLEYTQRQELERDMGTFIECHPHLTRPWEEEMIFPKERDLFNYLRIRTDVEVEVFNLWMKDGEGGYLQWLEKQTAILYQIAIQ